jgi:hypothetical protein
MIGLDDWLKSGRQDVQTVRETITAAAVVDSAGRGVKTSKDNVGAFAMTDPKAQAEGRPVVITGQDLLECVESMSQIDRRRLALLLASVFRDGWRDVDSPIVLGPQASQIYLAKAVEAQPTPR